MLEFRQLLNGGHRAFPELPENMLYISAAGNDNHDTCPRVPVACPCPTDPNAACVFDRNRSCDQWPHTTMPAAYTPTYPVTMVGALDPDVQKPAGYSNKGACVRFWSSGKACYPEIGTTQGTSFAAPVTTSVVAVHWAKNPTLGRVEVLGETERLSVPVPGYASLVQPQYLSAPAPTAAQPVPMTGEPYDPDSEGWIMYAAIGGGVIVLLFIVWLVLRFSRAPAATTSPA